MMKGEDKYGRNIVEQVVEPVNTTRKGRALFERSEFCSTPRSIYRRLDLRNSSFWNIYFTLAYTLIRLRFSANIPLIW